MRSLYAISSIFLVLALLSFSPTPSQAGELTKNPCNPCSIKQKNPCNPCSKKEKDQSSNPGKQDKGFTTFMAASDRGQKLWSDTALGTTGFSCLSGGCHGEFENLNLNKNQLYPHYVEMTEKVVTLTQMINYCLLNPMNGRALHADSDDMTAMAAFYRTYRMQYRKKNR
jgi:hypothetical protein